MAGQGRHSEYTPEIGDKICHLISTTPIGTKTLCKMHDWMPDDSTIYAWRIRHNDFASNYTLAKAQQAHLLAENIFELCEVETHQDKEGVKRADPGLVAVQRLKVDTTKWYASKLAPKIYGDKQIIEQTTAENETLKQELAELRAKLTEKNQAEY